MRGWRMRVVSTLVLSPLQIVPSWEEAVTRTEMARVVACWRSHCDPLRASARVWGSWSAYV